MNVQELISALFDKDILLTPAQAQRLTDRDAIVLSRLISNTEAIKTYLHRIERASQQKNNFPATIKGPSNVEVLRSYTKKPHKRSYEDFVRYFNTRFKTMERLLRSRAELSGVTSIERARSHTGRDRIALIGLVLEKRETKNEHIMLDLEDRSGSITALINKNKPDLHAIAQDLCFDELIGITGTVRDKLFFVDNIILPSIPVHQELKKSPDEAYMVCISDIHFGNKEFMAESFGTFLRWLNGETGSERMREIARKTHYVIVAGDLVEGVGVYPSQEGDLSIPDIYAQYRLCDEVLSSLNEEKQLILIPGNHDIGRLSEPQPCTPAELLPKLASRSNTYFLSNPSWLKLHSQGAFPGFTCLLYHGGSLIYYGNAVMRLFREGGVSNPCAIMQYLLQRRHLAPSHTSTLYVPDADDDPLIIDEVPDFLISGHLHMSQSKTWNGITMLNCSCWVPMTDYQMKQGLRVDPGRFMLVNLQTRAVQAVRPEELNEE